MSKVTGEKMTDAERRGDKTWYCQHDGNELDQRTPDDPTGRIKDPECGKSWWATDPPTKDEIKERTAALAAEKKKAAKP